MAISCSSPSLTAPWLPASPSCPPCASLSSACSVFFGNGGRALSNRRRLAAVSLRRRTGGRPGGLGCRCLFGLGVPELAVIAGVAVLIFGPKKLPEIGRSIGKTVKGFQQAAKEFETELKKDSKEESNVPSSVESPNAQSSEGEKKEIEAPSTEENI